MPLFPKSLFASIPRQSIALNSRPLPHKLNNSTRALTMSFETTGTINSFGGKLLKLAHKVCHQHGI